MKSKMLLTTVTAACFSLLLVGCGYGDKDEAGSSSSADLGTKMSDSMVDDIKDSAGSVVDSAKDMGSDAVDSVKDMGSDAVAKVEDAASGAVESGKAAMNDAVKDLQDQLPGSDLDTSTDAKADLEAEADSMKKELDGKMKDLL